ncbi:MAG: cellulose synthase operon protein YhjQ/BcsQ [Dermatophilaceae bacterium]
MSESRSPRGSAPGRVVGVVGACGGVGTTTLVAAMGASLAREGRSCAVVDLQRGGGGLDVPFGVEHLPGVRWADLAALEGPLDGAALLPHLPSAEGVAVLAHAREPGPSPDVAACVEVILGLRAQIDAVILDAPRDLAPDVLRHLDMALVLSGTGVLELSALAAASRRVGDAVEDTAVVLRGRREASALAEEVMRALGLPVLGWLRDDPRVHRNLARGRGPAADGPVGALAHVLLDAAFPEPSAVAS